jgi:hypothetical protein
MEKEKSIQELACELLGAGLIGLGHFDKKRMIDWAVYALIKGYETDSLVILAGLDYEERDVVERYFWQSVKELSLEIQSNNFLHIKSYAKWIAQEVLQDRMNPMKGLRLMVDIARATDYDNEYMPFIHLDDEIDIMIYTNTGLHEENKEIYIKEAFQNLLTS